MNDRRPLQEQPFGRQGGGDNRDSKGKNKWSGLGTRLSVMTIEKYIRMAPPRP